MSFRRDPLEQALEDAYQSVGDGFISSTSGSERLERQFVGGFTRDTSLDAIDLVATGLVGAVGAAVDLLLVAIPQDVVYLGKYPQSGSVLTKLFKAWTVPADNELARHAQVPFDRLDPRLPGMFPGNHRFLTPGHDPVLGLVIGVFDIVRGGRTAIGTDGAWHFHGGLTEPVPNVAAALAIELLHLLSDVATKAGLPAPLATLAGSLRFGSFGIEQRTVGDLARYMYLKGYDFLHFVTTCSTPLAIRGLLGAYFLGRQFVDGDYQRDVESSARRDAPSLRHPKLAKMTCLADAMACAANVGKIALYQGNPSAFNYGQWLAFLRSASEMAANGMESITDVLIDRAHANESELERRWDAIRSLADEQPTIGKQS